MSVHGRLILQPIFDFLWDAIRRIGTLVRWPFLDKKYRLEQIYEQNWSGIIGLIFLVSIICVCLLNLE